MNSMILSTKVPGGGISILLPM